MELSMFLFRKINFISVSLTGNYPFKKGQAPHNFETIHLSSKQLSLFACKHEFEAKCETYLGFVQQIYIYIYIYTSTVWLPLNIIYIYIYIYIYHIEPRADRKTWSILRWTNDVVPQNTVLMIEGRSDG